MHKDAVTQCVFTKENDFLITASKGMYTLGLFWVRLKFLLGLHVRFAKLPCIGLKSTYRFKNQAQ